MSGDKRNRRQGGGSVAPSDVREGAAHNVQLIPSKPRYQAPRPNSCNMPKGCVPVTVRRIFR
jgi:hypothetical protein